MRFDDISLTKLRFFVGELSFQDLRTFLLDICLGINWSIFNWCLFLYRIPCLDNFILINFFVNPFSRFRYSNINRRKSPLFYFTKKYMIINSLEVSIFLNQPLNQSIHGFIGSIMCDSISHLSKQFVFTLLDLLVCLAKFLIMSNA